MRRSMMLVAVAVAVAVAMLGGPASAQVRNAPPPTAMPTDAADVAPDYAAAASWLCRPGRPGPCATNLDAIAYDAAGRRTARPFTPAADPPVDCFYIYPTVSIDPTLHSDMVPDAPEEQVVVNQAARFAGACRLFVPAYRQVTLIGLRAAAAGPGKIGALDEGRQYDDVRAAWRRYLAADNKGRGVVLIGHSQGSILLRRLIREEIDGKPAQKLLVSALLAGNPDLTVKQGSDRGGSFASVPLCRADGQTGCVVAWSTYAADDPAPRRVFGAADKAGEVGACVNPAALAGGAAALDGFVPRPGFAPAEDPPFVEQVGQLSGECVADAQGAVFRVKVVDGPLAPLLQPLLHRQAPPGWGLHVADIPLVQGDLMRLVQRQGAAWMAGHK